VDSAAVDDANGNELSDCYFVKLEKDLRRLPLPLR
jgi:hypothetical protein